MFRYRHDGNSGTIVMYSGNKYGGGHKVIFKELQEINNIEVDTGNIFPIYMLQ